MLVHLHRRSSVPSFLFLQCTRYIVVLRTNESNFQKRTEQSTGKVKHTIYSIALAIAPSVDIPLCGWIILFGT
jgi:hypothetical protein